MRVRVPTEEPVPRVTKSRTALMSGSTAQKQSDSHFVPDHLAWTAMPSGDRYVRFQGADADGSPDVLVVPDRVSADWTGAHRLDRLWLPRSTRELIPEAAYKQLAAISPIVRVPTRTVWEAAATAIVRQVIHRDQARVVFSRMCAALGETVSYDGTEVCVFPDHETIAACTDAQLRSTGVGFKAKTLKTLAEWYDPAVDQLGVDEIHAELLRLRGVGPWTASVAVCDLFSDFSRYPIDDLAVRAQVAALWPARSWADGPGEFASEWQRATEPHTAVLTAFVLARGAIRP